MKVKVAIAHDYLTQRGGAERVVLAMSRLFPDAPIYTLLYDPPSTYGEFSHLNVRTGWLNRVPFLRKHHRWALPLLGVAAWSTRIEADVVIVSSSGWAHGIRTTCPKVVYCYSPARWLYQCDQYLGLGASITSRIALRALGPLLRRWDKAMALKANRYLAISRVVQQRIRDTYGIESIVVPAPVTLPIVRGDNPAVDGKQLASQQEGYFLVVARLLPYKNVDAIVSAFRSLPFRLVVVGEGPERLRLRNLASANVEFASGLSDAQMDALYRDCIALVAASIEDFGLTPLEAAARGRPSVVLAAGGFLDTVIDGKTGVYFERPVEAEIAVAVEIAFRREWDPNVLRGHAQQFSEHAFGVALRTALASATENT